MSEKDNTPENTNTPEVSEEFIAELTAKITDSVQQTFQAQLEDEQAKTKALKTSLDNLDERLKATKKDAEKEASEKSTAEEKIASLTTKHNELMNTLSQKERDSQVSQAVAGLNFTNQSAANLATKHLLSALSKGEDGSWSGEGGKSVADVVKEFVADESNAFLFKKADSTGSGTAGSGSTKNVDKQNPDANKPLKEQSVNDALSGYADGTRTPKTWGN